MSTTAQATVGTAWKDLNTALSLSDDSNYILTIETPSSKIKLVEGGSTAPTTFFGHTVHSDDEPWRVSPVSGTKIYARSMAGDVIVVASLAS